MVEIAQMIVPLIGTAAGFIFQSLSEARNQLYHLALEKAGKEDDSADKAAKRGSSALRWAIVGAILIAAIGAPIVYGTMDKVTIEQVTTKGGFLWGIFGPARNVSEYVQVNGFPILSEYREALMLAVFFVLGRRAGR